MPEVIIKAKSDWYPLDAQPESPQKSLRLSPKQQLMLAIGQKLPDIIVDAFRSILDEELKPGEVVYDFTKYNHYCSINQPDIGITLWPKWTQEREAHMEELRGFIRERLVDFLIVDRRVEPRTDDFPQIDVMIKFVVETGLSLDKRGEVTSTW